MNHAPHVTLCHDLKASSPIAARGAGTPGPELLDLDLRIAVQPQPHRPDPTTWEARDL
ncbi:hypothetical protein MCOR32_006145 [Pyricularia oryzae]|uniref:Uncharacterized protein n=1 Tax=Pyricularia grisea TaxID=148305 RepID=A0ABQ8NQF0_PYRGI|nr:hypothetical protein MCOR26_005279 [Pyricularia oryzae]KAI6300467.1 hypothetical protein MCOR33_003872 [Pyricularia grisea]KAI6321443.1 hypothetical protein MCOR34_002645 [Pyricularia oryzae]KAI6371540.1 hypothetical protein MCOR32_006145 [Pyricularia oryzae]KAI6474611.1 hypothetical protein MCOR17_002049 [Pyricularia oryzae]